MCFNFYFENFAEIRGTRTASTHDSLRFDALRLAWLACDSAPRMCLLCLLWFLCFVVVVVVLLAVIYLPTLLIIIVVVCLFLVSFSHFDCCRLPLPCERMLVFALFLL